MDTQGESIASRIGTLSFTHDFANGYPTRETVEKLYDERDFQRACQAYLWALPIVGVAEVQHAAQSVLGARDLDVVIYEAYAGKLGILTANATTPYICSYPDLARTGPLVINVPAGAGAGFVDDFWQRPVTDFGLPGPDRGKGAKYLIVGPGQTVADTDGFRVMPSSTMNLVIAFRNLETDPERADRLQRDFRLYPYAQRDESRRHPLRAGRRKEVERDPSARAGLLGTPRRNPQPRAGAGTRPHHDGHAPVYRHREGQTLQPRCTPEDNSDRSRARRRGDGEGERLRQAADGTVALRRRATGTTSMMSGSDQEAESYTQLDERAA